MDAMDVIRAIENDVEVSMKQQGYVVAYTEEELQKIADLQQSMIEKAFDLGREDAMSEIVRCRDCKEYSARDHRCRWWNHGTKEAGWCYVAERREE